MQVRFSHRQVIDQCCTPKNLTDNGTNIPFVESQLFVIRLAFHYLLQVFRALYDVLLFVPLQTAHNKIITFRVYHDTLYLLSDGEAVSRYTMCITLVAFAQVLTLRAMISRRPIMQEVRHHPMRTLTAHRVANSDTFAMRPLRGWHNACQLQFLKFPFRYYSLSVMNCI